MARKRILNVGCGNSSYGTDRIDLYPTAATTKVVNVDKEGLPYKPNTFDEVYARNILEHLKNVGFFVDECYRVLKKGGKIYIRTDHAGYILNYLLKRNEHNQGLAVQYKKGGSFGHGQEEDWHYYLFVESHLRGFFKKFQDIKIKYVIGSNNRIKKAILSLLPKNIGACHLDLTARKL